MPQNSIAIARQTILDNNLDVFDCELFNRSLTSTSHTAASEASIPFNVLLRADCEVLVDRKNIFITCTHEALAGGHLEMIQPDGVILEIPFLAVTATDEIEARLHALTDIAKRGFRLAFDHAALTRPYVRWLTLASFIKLDLSKLCNRVH